MNEHPILFSGEMVRAILAGRKTQTRRVVKGTALEWLQPKMFSPAFVAMQDNKLSPYGYAGDLLWVRETWCPDWTDHVIYKADGGSAIDAGYKTEPRWRPSIHMPRAASRITLEVVSVRVERVQEVSPEDCFKEGVVPEKILHPVTPTRLFSGLWDSINAKRGYSWESNPWVWVVEFKQVNNLDTQK